MLHYLTTIEYGPDLNYGSMSSQHPPMAPAVSGHQAPPTNYDVPTLHNPLYHTNYYDKD